MSALCKHTWQIASDIDISDTAQLNQLFKTSRGEPFSTENRNYIQACVSAGTTTWDKFELIVDPVARTMTRVREFTTLEAANERCSWLLTNSSTEYPEGNSQFTLLDTESCEGDLD